MQKGCNFAKESVVRQHEYAKMIHINELVLNLPCMIMHLKWLAVRLFTKPTSLTGQDA